MTEAFARICCVALLKVAVAGLMAAAIFHAWTYLGYRGRSGAEVYLLHRHGFGAWRLVAACVGRRVSHLQHNGGRWPADAPAAIEAAITDAQRLARSGPYALPEGYDPTQWECVEIPASAGEPKETVLRYIVPERGGVPGFTLFVRKDGSFYRVLSGPWHPVWWWEIVAPHGWREFFGQEAAAY